MQILNSEQERRVWRRVSQEPDLQEASTDQFRQMCAWRQILLENAAVYEHLERVLRAQSRGLLAQNAAASRQQASMLGAQIYLQCGQKPQGIKPCCLAEPCACLRKLYERERYIADAASDAEPWLCELSQSARENAERIVYVLRLCL